jgi:hypothetical protein
MGSMSSKGWKYFQSIKFVLKILRALASSHKHQTPNTKHQTPNTKQQTTNNKR